MGSDWWKKDYIRYRKGVSLDYDTDKDEYNIRIVINDVVKMACLSDLSFPDICKVINFLEEKEELIRKKLNLMKKNIQTQNKRYKLMVKERKQCILYLTLLREYINSNRKIKVKFDLMDM